MKKIKILHLTTSLKIGGAESLLCNLLRNLDPNQFENHVVYFHHGSNAENLKNLNIKIYQIKGLFFRYDPIFFIKLFFLIKKINPNCIHSLLWSANFTGSIISKILKIPIICAIHSGINTKSLTINDKLRIQLDKITFSCATKIVTVSNEITNFINQSSPKYNKKITTIKNAIDTNYILYQASQNILSREQFGLTSNDFIIGSVARFVSLKRHGLLLEVFSNLIELYPNWKLFLIGQGPLENFLKNKTKELKIKDKVIFIKSNQAISFYKLFDCFTLISQQEGLSIALLEAMCFGLPCIITNKNQQHEVMISKLNGFIVTENENNYLLKNEISQCLINIYNNENLRKNTGLNAKQTILEKFNFNDLVKSYSNLFAEYQK